MSDRLVAVFPALHAELAARVTRIMQDRSLVEPVGFVARDAARNVLLEVIARIETLIAGSEPGEQGLLRAVQQDALGTIARLDEADEQLFADYRGRISSGAIAPAAFRALLRGYAAPALQEEWSDPPRYDCLDAFIDGLLRITVAPATQDVPEPEMVPYQTTPVRVVLDMVDRLTLSADDVLYDLGSGLGRVVMTVALASAGRVTGVEVEPAYVDYARQRARELSLDRVTFVNADAREVDYADGTVFFLYTPFKGKMLQRVLALLRHQARTRPIRICTYGPGTLDVQDQDWLVSADDPERDIHHVTIFESTRTYRRTSALRRVWRRSHTR